MSIEIKIFIEIIKKFRTVSEICRDRIRNLSPEYVIPTHLFVYFKWKLFNKSFGINSLLLN